MQVPAQQEPLPGTQAVQESLSVPVPPPLLAALPLPLQAPLEISVSVQETLEVAVPPPPLEIAVPQAEPHAGRRLQTARVG